MTAYELIVDTDEIGTTNIAVAAAGHEVGRIHPDANIAGIDEYPQGRVGVIVEMGAEPNVTGGIVSAEEIALGR